MSITIIQSPKEYTPAYNPIYWVVDSDNKSEDGFQYVFDVYIRGVQVSRHRIPPRVNLGVAKFDCAKIVEAYVTHDISYSTVAFERNTNSWADVVVHFGEEYIVAGVVTTYIDIETSDKVYAINASLTTIEYAGWNDSIFLLSGGSKRFLTSQPQGVKVLSYDSYWLHFIAPVPEDILKVIIRMRNGNTVVSSHSYSPTDLSNAVDGDMFLRIGCGTKQITDLFGAGVYAGCDSYSVFVAGAADAPLSEERFFLLDSPNCKYENIRLQFLNKMGGFDAFNFKLISKQESDIVKKNYGVVTGAFNSDNEFIYSANDRSSQTMSITITDTYKVNSDWISEDESAWLKELVTSPIVFQEKAGQLIPVRINETKYNTQKVVNEKLFNLSISFDYGNPSNRQRY